jgi:hypothetical protein
MAMGLNSNPSALTWYHIARYLFFKKNYKLIESHFYEVSIILNLLIVHCVRVFWMTCLHVIIQNQGFPTWMLDDAVMYWIFNMDVKIFMMGQGLF